MIFVTGIAGYIGSHTAVELLTQGYDVVGADNFCNSSREAVDRIRELTGRDFSFYNIDVRDEGDLDEIFNAHKVDCVIHFAGLKAVGESVRIPIDYYTNNLNSTIALCSCMQKHGVKKIIFSSSATVYSSDDDMPLTEESAVGNCASPYGWTKLMCEQILRDTASANREWAVSLLRYFNPIGAHESGRIGENPKGVPNNLMPYITMVAVGRLPVLRVFGNDYETADGTGMRDYIHVVDLAKGHVEAIRYLENRTGTHVFNLGTGRGTTVLELVNAFEKVTGQKVPMEMTARREGDLPICFSSVVKAERLLYWTADMSIEQACEDAWRWQSQNPDGYR